MVRGIFESRRGKEVPHVLIHFFRVQNFVFQLEKYKLYENTFPFPYLDDDISEFPFFPPPVLMNFRFRTRQFSVKFPFSATEKLKKAISAFPCFSVNL